MYDCFCHPVASTFGSERMSTEAHELLLEGSGTDSIRSDWKVIAGGHKVGIAFAVAKLDPGRLRNEVVDPGLPKLTARGLLDGSLPTLSTDSSATTIRLCLHVRSWRDSRRAPPRRVPIDPLQPSAVR